VFEFDISGIKYFSLLAIYVAFVYMGFKFIIFDLILIVVFVEILFLHSKVSIVYIYRILNKNNQTLCNNT